MKKKIFCILLLVLVCVFTAMSLVGCAGDLGKKVGEATITIECKTILDNMGKVDQGLLENDLIPKDGVILGKTVADVFENDNVYTLLKRVCKQKKIHLDCSYDHYIRGINYIYEMSVGESSGWMYFVDGSEPNKGIGQYKLVGGENIKIAYTCAQGDLK